MCRVFAVQVQVERGPMVGFEDSEIFLVQMFVDFMSGVERKQKRVVGIIGIEYEHGPQVRPGVPGNRSEICVEQVVPFLVQLCVMEAEYLVEVRASSIDL